MWTCTSLEPAERKHVKNTPGSLLESLQALEADHAFLLDGGVFTQDLIDTWLAMKRTKDVDAVALRPHPYEFFLYYDVLTTRAVWRQGRQTTYRSAASLPPLPPFSMPTKREILEAAKKQDVTSLRLQFTDILGVNKNVEVPESQFAEGARG